MFEIDWAAAGVLSTGLVSLMVLAAWVGTISERVKHHTESIKENDEQNHTDHQIIFDKLDDLRELIGNGRH